MMTDSATPCPFCASDDTVLEANFATSLMVRRHYCRACRSFFEAVPSADVSLSGARHRAAVDVHTKIRKAERSLALPPLTTPHGATAMNLSVWIDHARSTSSGVSFFTLFTEVETS